MFLTCPTLSAQPHIRHGFFTRREGHSHGLYTSLNCGYGSGDDIETVSRNREKVAAALDAELPALCTAYQIHSPTVAVLEKPWAWKEAPEADALVTATPGIALGILTADCVPVLFSDGKSVIGAAHAGWKGAFSGVVEATLAAMEKLGAHRADIHATIGPAIAQCSYETGPEFIQRLVEHNAENEAFFTPSPKPGHHLFNLKGYVASRLKALGVHANTLENDTLSEEDSFFSFRRATLRGEPAYGRHISAIILK